MIIETENKLFTIKLVILALGATGVGAAAFLSPIWGLYANCALAGLQAFFVAELVRTTLTLKKLNAKPLKGLAAHPRERWGNTNAWIKENQTPEDFS